MFIPNRAQSTSTSSISTDSARVKCSTGHLLFSIAKIKNEKFWKGVKRPSVNDLGNANLSGYGCLWNLSSDATLLRSYKGSLLIGRQLRWWYHKIIWQSQTHKVVVWTTPLKEPRCWPSPFLQYPTVNLTHPCVLSIWRLLGGKVVEVLSEVARWPSG